MSNDPDKHDEFLRDGVRFLREFFDLSAESYGLDIEPAFAPLVDGLIEFAGPLGSGAAIDLGTGTGLAARALRRAGTHAVAVDFSRSMLSRARENDVRLIAQADLH